MKRSKGMTLMELLIAMGLSAIIMSSAFVIVRFSASTYDATVQAIHENNNTSDAVDIINRYIRRKCRKIRKGMCRRRSAYDLLSYYFKNQGRPHYRNKQNGY